MHCTGKFKRGAHPFCFDIQFFEAQPHWELAPSLEVGASTMVNPGSATALL